MLPNFYVKNRSLFNNVCVKNIRAVNKIRYLTAESKYLLKHKIW